MEQRQPVLTPGAKYTWPEDAQFTLTGVEFSQLFNALENYMHTDAYQAKAIEVATVSFTHQMMVGKLEKAVTDGVAIAADTQP